MAHIMIEAWVVSYEARLSQMVMNTVKDVKSAHGKIFLLIRPAGELKVRID